jgi:DNA polymerase III subunit epsilon
MALIMGYDTETTGLDVRTDYILEVGAAIYDTEIKQIVKTFQAFLLWSARPLISKEIEEITGINQAMLEKWGITGEEAFSEIFRLADNCEYIVSHNGYIFDKPITESNVLRCHDPSSTLKKKFYDSKWIDTLVDLPFPKKMNVRSLKYLAFDHGYIMNKAHRAMADVEAMIHVFSCYDWNQIQEILASPIETQIVKCEWFEKEKHEELKNAGFKFDKPSKSWKRSERKYFSNMRKDQLSFSV